MKIELDSEGAIFGTVRDRSAEFDLYSSVRQSARKVVVV
jgi:hypothetical protein